jgi:2'-5' RNA ligase
MEPARIRAFVAVNFSPDVHQTLVRLKAELGQVSRRAHSDIRWTRDEGLHVTLKFLGAVPLRQLEDVYDALAKATGSMERFDAHVRGLGAFPSMGNPRVVWVGLEAPALVNLAHAIENGLAALGFPGERRAFHPHVTLGRVRGRRGWKEVEEVLKLHWTDDFGVSPIEEVVLYRSDLHPGGAVYTSLWTRALADSRRGVFHGTG